ncbi:MAG: hypothetical protein KA146_03055 [Leptospiraceae bacterium]|nr:hypothetical protein [Leptospiraceae bacterium]
MKYIYLFAVTFLIQASLFADSKVVLGEEEIRKAPYTKFENRSDKFATPELKAIEVEIGKGLHEQVIETNKPINYKGFTLQRFYSDEPGKFGGDILVLNKNASYGHINSIKRILNAYIQSSFEYTEKNADVLVMEVLYYNAQNRQKLDRIKKRYTKSLVAALNKNKVGIGKKFNDWPGNTQIVIPIKSSAESKTPAITENKTEKKTETKTEEKKEPTSTEKNPVTEREKIKPTKPKVPSSEMSKESITNTSKTVDDKKTPAKEVAKESKPTDVVVEKKNIEERVVEKDKGKTTNITESEVKQPEKTKDSNPEIKKAVTIDKPVAKDTKPTVVVEEKKTPAKEPAKEVAKETKPTVVVEEKKTPAKEPAKEAAKEIKPAVVIEEKKTPAKEPVKEAAKETKPAVVTEEKKTPAKEPVKEAAKETKPAVVTEEKKTPAKEPAKAVVMNETRPEPAKAATVDKPVEKESKLVEQPKKVEEPKKEAPKTVVTPPAKKVEEKLPTTKTEIKKMAQELTELKAKEKDKVENSENVVGEKIVFLKVKEFLAEGHYTSEMWAVDTENDDELFQSPFKKVCGKEFKELGTGVVVMSFKENDVIGTDTHHLALLNKDNLKLIKQTQEIIFWRSFVKEQSGKIYAIEVKDGKYYLAQFKEDLTFEMRSSDPINPDCEIAFKKNKIYLTKRAQDNSGVSIRVLNRDNLKLRDLKVMK